MSLTRTELKLAEALGLAQATRYVAETVERATDDEKVARRIKAICEAWSTWQERLNELVAGNAEHHDELLARAAEVRDLHQRMADERIAAGDELDALEVLAGLAAQDQAHWRIIRELATAQGDKRTFKLAEQALDGSKRQLKDTVKACGSQAKAVAKRLEPA
jgi:hypothetical protein